MMTGKVIENLWKAYPESHLHCDVTMAGLHTYRIVASLISREGEALAVVEHYGSGELNDLKEQAYQLLAAELEKIVDA